MPRDSARPPGPPVEDVAGHSIASPVRKERIKKSKKELEEEAAKILEEADRIDCITRDHGVHPDKFYTLPSRKSKRVVDYPTRSLDKRALKRNHVNSDIPPRKPPRTYATISSPQPAQKTSIFDIFRKNDKKSDIKKSNLKRNHSSELSTKSQSSAPRDNLTPLNTRQIEHDELKDSKNKKKQLTPINEDFQRSDYFQLTSEDKENIDRNELLSRRVENNNKRNKEESITDQLKQYIDEVDEALYKETGIRLSPTKEIKPTEIVIIDVDKAEKISKKKKFRLKDTALGKKLRSISKKNKSNDALKNIQSTNRSIQITPIKDLQNIINNAEVKNSLNSEFKTSTPRKSPVRHSIEAQFSDPITPSPRIKAAIDTLENRSKNSQTMIHSSQQPTDKPPLTRGYTVDTMVKRLSNEAPSPPPMKSNIMVTPSYSIQHNNNQPFSYTRGLSPEKYTSNENSPEPSSPIIYAQVVCGNSSNGIKKQTVHTAYRKQFQNSDSDEGLGYEENSNFRKRYEPDKPAARFPDLGRDDSFNRSDINDNEDPITPKFRNTAYLNGYTEYDNKFTTNGYKNKTERTFYVDSSSRGRGDGMDSRRRESLTEGHENGFTTKLNGIHMNSRSDLSARRDLLESRINQRLQEKHQRLSPDYKNGLSPTNVYVKETSSKYYRSGSTSPVGYKEKYISETKPDKYGVSRTVESRSKQTFGKDDYDNEPKSFDSQISDYRSSPENKIFETSHNNSSRYRNETQKLFKDREYYRSNPEIYHRLAQEDARKYDESYHDSLRREKQVTKTSKYVDEKYLIDQSERKDKFGDSGIENDFKRDSSERYRPSRPPLRRQECYNDSEDEGFASSLLIASERQHTEENINQRRQERAREEDLYRHLESMDYRSGRIKQEYVPRERSIDDGSHFDPRIDKEFEKSTLRKVDKKPPKPEKKSGLEKVKQLFSRDSKKKKEKGLVSEENLRARYTEYKGSTDELDSKYKKKNVSDLSSSHQHYGYGSRNRLSSVGSNSTQQRNGKPAQQRSTEQSTHGSWFKSLDRLARKKPKKQEVGQLASCTEDESPSKPTKNLRFFGDTDQESNGSVRGRTRGQRPVLVNGRYRSQSTNHLHDISEERHRYSPDRTMPIPDYRRNGHKSMLNIATANGESDRELKGSRSSLKPPMSPSHRGASSSRETPPARSSREERLKRRKNEVSSVESSTEGDSSQQSQRSVVYLHAATVGDIPGPGFMKNSRRSASREDLTSNNSNRMQTQSKTLSRSFSVLAPWRPRHFRESMDIDYTQHPKPVKNGKYEQKLPRNSTSRKETTSTLKKKAQETRRNNQAASTLNRRSRSKENLSQGLRRSREDVSKGSTSSLYKKKERLPRENSRYSREDKKISTKSTSVESLGSGRSGRRTREEIREVSRSVSMPRNPDKSAGWFRMNKKSKSGSTQRL